MNYQKHYGLLIERARVRKLEGYSERHHITPKCLGGNDDPDNLVDLTPEEHYIAHQLLVKMYPSHPGLVWAAIKMTQNSFATTRSNKLYGWLKRKHSAASKMRTGEANGAFKARWIHNPVTLEAARIKADDSIPHGWKLGRVPQNKCEVCGVECKTAKYCAIHSAEARAQTCRNNSAAAEKKGRIYINNGSRQQTHDPADPIPEGFVIGGLPRNRKT